MVRKYLALLAIASIVFVQPPAASAQLNLRLGPLNIQIGQGGMVCLGDAEGRAAQQAGQAMPLTQILERLGNIGQLVSQQFCRLDGRFVWVLSVRNGGAVTQRVIDAATGQQITGP